MQQISGAADGARVPLSLKLWIDRDGVISRVEFAPFAHPQPNEDLRALLIGRKLPAVPPKDLLLPLRLALRVALVHFHLASLERFSALLSRPGARKSTRPNSSH